MIFVFNLHEKIKWTILSAAVQELHKFECSFRDIYCMKIKWNWFFMHLHDQIEKQK